MLEVLRASSGVGLDSALVGCLSRIRRWRGPACYGWAFDPTAAPEVDTTMPIADRPIGGLGIHMMRRLCDRLTYHRLGDTKRLELLKAFDAG